MSCLVELNEDRCVYCVRVMTSFDAAVGPRPTDRHRDHLIPRSRGGSDDIENCVVACGSCNLDKRDKTPSEWRPIGLPAWIYQKEKSLAAKYRMPPRGKSRQQDPSVRVPGYAMLKTKTAVCLEYDRQPCRHPADWEARSPLGDDGWGAYCSKCIRYWAEHLRRELDEVRRSIHILAQLRCGTLRQESETVLLARARVGGVSFDEYLDLAGQMLTGDNVVRLSLKEAFPDLGLDVWEPR